MIFGYISQKNDLRPEYNFRTRRKKEEVFRFDLGNKEACFLKEGIYSQCLYQDPVHLLLCDGIPVRCSEAHEYKLLDKIDEREIHNGFFNIIDNIASNVSMIFYKNTGKRQLFLSSNRASNGRIFYTYDHEGIAFSSNFTYLLNFVGAEEVNYKAIYSIIRYGAAIGPMTIGKSISAIPAGHYAVYDIDQESISIHPYFQFDFSQDHGFNLKFANRILTNSAKLLKKLGCSLLLSGGVDSALLACKINEDENSELKAYHLQLNIKDPAVSFAREAAINAKCKLIVFNITEKEVLETVTEAAKSYSHPFNDYSTIPSFYLIKQVYSDQEKQILIDGSAGDACFGFKTLFEKRWEVFFRIPAFVKILYNRIFLRFPFWKSSSYLAGLMRTIAKCTESELNLCPLVLCTKTELYKDHLIDYDIEIAGNLTKLINFMLTPDAYNCSFKARATLADIMHVCSNMFCAKTAAIDVFADLHTLFPYMWKEILVEQGRLSWSAKANKGVIKWPLKKLLEFYMPESFIYQEKRGLVPPLERWFKGKETFELLRDTLLDPHSVVTNLFEGRKMRNIIENLKKNKNWSNNLCHFLWGTLFVELWIRNHKMRFQPL